MIIACDCSYESFHNPSVCSVLKRKARKKYKCEECGCTINRGETYERTSGKWDDWETHIMCLGCSRIKDRFCSGGYIFGQLAEQVSECIGFDYVTDDP